MAAALPTPPVTGDMDATFAASIPLPADHVDAVADRDSQVYRDPTAIALPPSPSRPRHLAGRGQPPMHAAAGRAVSGKPDGWVSTIPTRAAPTPSASGRKVSGAMSWAYKGEAEAEAAHDINDEHNRDGDETDSDVDDTLNDDDECVAYVRAQLAHLFPDLHAPLGPTEMAEIHDDVAERVGRARNNVADGEADHALGDEPTFRAELVSLREEIARLRGVVGGLAAGMARGADATVEENVAAASQEASASAPKSDAEGATDDPAAAPPDRAAAPAPATNGLASVDDTPAPSSPATPPPESATGAALPAAFTANAPAALDVVRALDMRLHSRVAPDDAVFAASNLDMLLARVRADALSEDTPVQADI